ncbi:hypothetical protein R1sor_008442 [Riccia sorocarpa]|uniref:Uncharacterized protein n=1 Tax=Riccia sorocarpa TaxID=122646 RepID=A0ABD3HVJ5_9MARC
MSGERVEETNVLDLQPVERMATELLNAATRNPGPAERRQMQVLLLNICIVLIQIISEMKHTILRVSESRKRRRVQFNQLMVGASQVMLSAADSAALETDDLMEELLCGETSD